MGTYGVYGPSSTPGLGTGSYWLPGSDYGLKGPDYG